MLTRVTITGADDEVDPFALWQLSREFPFVEWGILRSQSSAGQPRYPTDKWRAQLSHGIGLSSHLCGVFARNVLAGSAIGSVLGDSRFQRLQVNGYVAPSPGLIEVANCWTGVEFILQVRNEASLAAAAKDVTRIHHRRGSLLFDPSGGRGEHPSAWPLPPEGLPMGYAGGITPDNVVETIESIGHIAAPFWIDMESGVRTDDRFDLAKVRRVLELCAPYVTKESRDA